jgi:hypothetical protein
VEPSNVLTVIIVQPQWIHQAETELAPTAQVPIPHQSGDMNFWKILRATFCKKARLKKAPIFEFFLNFGQ